MGIKHLELIKKDNHHFIKINSWTGRISLLFDHPVFNWVQAKNLDNPFYKTKGNIQLVPLRKKDMYIMEDIGLDGFKAQNFVYVDSETSLNLNKVSLVSWLKSHIFEFLTKSVSIFYVVIYFLSNEYVARYYGLKGVIQLGFLFGVPGLILLPPLHYYFWSSKTKSSYLKFLFRFEFTFMFVTALLYFSFSRGYLDFLLYN